MDFTQPHLIFSVENPLHPAKIPAPTHEQAMEWLKAQGEDAHDAMGYYGAPERSIVIMNPKNPEGINQLAQDIGQESVLHSKNGQHELKYVNGPNRNKTIKGHGTTIHSQAPADFFTTIKDNQGDRVHFTHNLDFNQFHEPIIKSEELFKSEDHGLCSMFIFDGVNHPDVLHCTHKYFGKDFKDTDKVLEILKLWFKENPFKIIKESFDKEEFFGEKNDIRVLRPESNKKFLPELKDKLEELTPDKWPEYKPHVTVSANVDKIDIPIVDYALVKGGKVLWSVNNKLYKSEELFKSPMPYNMYDRDKAANDPLPDLAHDDSYVHLKTVNLPNGLEYRKYKHRRSLPESQRLVHAMYDPSQKYEPLAYMETAHEEDASAKAGYHPHAIQWSEVQPDHRGKGLGRQLYLATLIHGTGRLTSGENISPEANKAWESFRNYPGFHGKIAYYPKSNNELVARPSLADQASERHRVAVKDRTKLDYNKMFPPINKALTKSEIEIYNILEKAIDDKAWNRIVKGHNKAVEAGSSIVDDIGHLNYFNSSHKDYKNKVLDHPEIAPADKHDPSLGVSPKLIHTIPSNNDDHDIKYMAKPYHAPVEKWASKWAKHPIKGWASLSTNKLFHAADMGDLVEEIGGHMHNGVPLVVSKFNPEAEGTYNNPQLNLKDVAKIGIMDFLTNNQDRHNGNMMHVSGTPLAIDHERNLNYFDHKPGVTPGTITPQHALQQWDSSAARNIVKNDHIIHGDLVDWWNQNGHNIKNEMQKNLKFIKDPKVKSHIEDNFNQRWDLVHNSMEDNDLDRLFHNERSFPGVKNIPFVKERKKKV